MGLREAVAFLKGAVAKTSNGQPAQYVFHDGVVYAQGAAVLAAYPVPHVLGTFGLSANELEAALGRMDGEPTVEDPADGTIVLRHGRLRSTIDLFPATPPGHALNEGTAWVDPPPGLLRAVAAVLPFMADSGIWERSVELKAGAVRAFSPPHTCMIDVDGLEVDGPTALSDEAATYLAKLPIEPSGWVRLDGALGFRWLNGAWARCQMISREWPGVIDTKVFPTAYTDCPVAVDDGWREAFADIKALGEGVVDLSPDGMTGRSPHGVHVANFRTEVTRQTRWGLAALANVLAVAEAWDPDAEGPSAFRGRRLRGVVAEMSR